MNSNLNGTKRKLESDVQAMQSDLDDQNNELRAAEEHAKKAMADAARLAEDLRQEQVISLDKGPFRGAESFSLSDCDRDSDIARNG